GVSLDVQPGEVVCLIGPSGSCKSTVLRCINGFETYDEGSITIDGVKVDAHTTRIHELRMRVCMVFQRFNLIAHRTALENVMVGRHVRTKHGLLGAVFQTPAERQEEREIKERAIELLEYVGVLQYADYTSRNLSYGHQRRLEIARALATDPKLLALDEPAAGMNATEKVELTRLLDKIRSDGRTILLIEHDVKLVMGLCNRMTVLDYGKVIAEGLPQDVQKNPKVIE
ncbi:ABC transporter ATP-binding protein, partial [Bacillus licheniformis]|nr:ABC transporter ATP-binding protein [Bacillus licheniformis]